MTKFPDHCTLRRGLPADLAHYAALCRETFSETFRESHTEDALARHVASAFPDAQLLAELSSVDQTVLAVEAGGAWIGYALVSRGPAPSGVHGTVPVQIDRFYVSSAWHGRGVALPLMQAALNEARQLGGDVAWLGVWEQNLRALRFYFRQGFAQVGRHVYLFDGMPEHDLVLALSI